MSLPEQFANVTAHPLANLYFDGRVVSHTIFLADGAKKTLGVVFPGRYTFDTGVAERMEVTSGACHVEVAGGASPRSFTAGTAFEVPAQSSFVIEVSGEPMQYICSYLGSQGS